MHATKPIVITTISGTGPLMALDLNTAPAAVLLPIVQAAMRVADEWDNANIPTPEYEGAEDALTELSKTVTALSDLLVTTIPGTPYTTRGDLMDQDTYPIIRNGQVEQLKAADLTPLELEAVRHWLEFHAHISAHHAEFIKQRISEFAETSGKSQGDSGYVEAAAPDWRLA